MCIRDSPETPSTGPTWSVTFLPRTLPVCAAGSVVRSRVRYPCRAVWSAVRQAMVVLPTPPLPAKNTCLVPFALGCNRLSISTIAGASLKQHRSALAEHRHSLDLTVEQLHRLNRHTCIQLLGAFQVGFLHLASLPEERIHCLSLRDEPVHDDSRCHHAQGCLLRLHHENELRPSRIPKSGYRIVVLLFAVLDQGDRAHARLTASLGTVPDMFAPFDRQLQKPQRMPCRRCIENDDIPVVVFHEIGELVERGHLLGTGTAQLFFHNLEHLVVKELAHRSQRALLIFTGGFIGIDLHGPQIGNAGNGCYVMAYGLLEYVGQVRCRVCCDDEALLAVVCIIDRRCARHRCLTDTALA